MKKVIKKLRYFWGIYFNNIFLRGASKISSPISFILLLFNSVILFFGRENPYIWFYTFLFSAMGIAVSVIYGYIDYSSKGTFQLEDWQNLKNSASLYVTYAQMKQIKAISEKEGIPLDEDFSTAYKAVEQYIKNSKVKKLYEGDAK